MGVTGSNNELKGELHIGYDLNDPLRNYFYGEVTALTVKQLMNAFNRTVVLPQVIESSHFPHGLLVSYTSNPNGEWFFLAALCEWCFMVDFFTDCVLFCEKYKILSFRAQADRKKNKN